MRIIEGRNPVLEALKNDQSLDKIIIDKDLVNKGMSNILSLAKEKGIIVKHVDKKALEKITECGSHQGVIAEVLDFVYCEIEDILNKAYEKNEKPFILILDEITDVHNLGAIIRSAECLGAHGIIIPKRRAAQINGTVSKTSAGAVDMLPVCRVTNLNQTIEKLKDKGLWIYGADMSGQKYIFEEKLDQPIGVVIGSEGNGIARLLKENCDSLVKIPMKGTISSLNASCAASIIIYEVIRQRGL